MIRTDVDRKTGVNYNLRNDFSPRTFDRCVLKLVRIGRTKQRAMWRARKDLDDS